MVERGEKRGERRRLVSGANAVLLGVLTLVAVVLINAVFSQVYWRYDLTANKIFTLSPASVDVVRALEEPVEVRVFISPNMPPPFHTLAQQVEELLVEYEARSDGKLSFQIITPEDDPALEEVARGYGIEQVAIGQQTDTEVSYRAVYKGVAFVQGDEVEVIRDLRVTGGPGQSDFEYEFTRALLNLSRAKPRRVAFVADGGGPAAHPEFARLANQLLEQVYGSLLRAEVIRLDELDRVPEEIAALVILNVQGDFSDEALFVLDQYLRSGGNVGWFQSGSIVDEERQRQLFEEMQAQGVMQPIPQFRKPLESNLVEYFGTLGVQLGVDAVLDRERGLSAGVAMTEHGPARVSHPGTFSITGIDRGLPFSRYFSTLALPLPSTVAVDRSALGPEVEVYEVLRTEATSVRRSPPQLAFYQELARPERDEEPGPFVVAAALEGPLPTYYRDAPIPASRREAELVSPAQEARLLVVGSGDLIGEYREAGYEGHLTALGMQFFLNSVEWLAQEGQLGEIRGKAMPSLLTDVPSSIQRQIQLVNVVIVPLFFATLGLYMWLRRRRRKQEFGELGQAVASTES